MQLINSFSGLIVCRRWRVLLLFFHSFPIVLFSVLRGFSIFLSSKGVWHISHRKFSGQITSTWSCPRRQVRLDIERDSFHIFQMKIDKRMSVFFCFSFRSYFNLNALWKNYSIYVRYQYFNIAVSFCDSFQCLKILSFVHCKCYICT